MTIDERKMPMFSCTSAVTVLTCKSTLSRSAREMPLHSRSTLKFCRVCKNRSMGDASHLGSTGESSCSELSPPPFLYSQKALNYTSKTRTIELHQTCCTNRGQSAIGKTQNITYVICKKFYCAANTTHKNVISIPELCTRGACMSRF